MGGSVSCCISPRESPKRLRRELDLEDCPITADVIEETGTCLQHISDRELPDGERRSHSFAQYSNIEVDIY